MLDAQVYDRQKQYSPHLSGEIFATLKRRAGLGDDLGSVLEIGAGTGLLTVGMLAGSRFEHALITDISADMLDVCRARVTAALPDASKVEFATYEAGGSAALPAGAFDLCVGHSVLHHVANYQAFLAVVRASLKPGGVAVFVEPAEAYHDAMARTVADALCFMIAWQSVGAGSDARRLARWVTDIRVRQTIDPRALEAMEDKHLFTREALVAAGMEAGFAAVEAVANCPDPDGVAGMVEYAREIGVSQAFADSFFVSYRRYAAVQFRALAAEDRTGMYVGVFRR